MTDLDDPAAQAPDTAGRPQLLDLLRDVTEHAAAIGEVAFAGTPLSLASSGLLLAICEHPGVTIAELSRQIPKTQQSIGQVVARLVRLDLVERRVGPVRGIALYATSEGRELAAVALQHERAIETRLREIVGPPVHRQLVDVLVKARATLRTARREG